MCDIIGIMDIKDNINSDKINAMSEMIINRKSNNVVISNPISGCYFGLTCSDKPIYNENRTLLLYFNGEIYNYKELKNILSSKGHVFNTEDKAEVVIHLFEEFGKESLKYLDGMFSLCILNTITKSLLIARDRYGIKPMYYSYCDNCFYIASNLKSIINVKAKNKINKMAIELYTNLRFIPAPYTIIEDINKLRAGEWLIFENGNIEVNNYIKYDDIYENSNNIDISQVIKNNILTTYDFNEKTGVFLSGGIDSAIVTSVLREQTEELKTFSVGYEVKTENDETEVAKKIATELNVSNLCCKLKNNELLELLNNTVFYLDEPLYSTVSVSTLKLSQMSNSFVKCVLTGDGSDEIFFGYKYLREALKQTEIEKSYLNSIGWLKETKYSELFLKTALKEDDIKDLLFEGCRMNNYAETFRRIELFKRLPDYHLPRMERLTKSYGLEVRIPFLRNNIVELILGIKDNELLNDLEPKKILKTCMESYLTPTMKEIKKRPFTSPTKQWIEDVLNDDIKMLFSNRELVTLCGFNITTINNLLDKYRGTYSDVSEIWGIYILLKWMEQNKKYIC